MILNGGSAYLPWRIVGSRIEDGILHRVADMPAFSRPVFAAYIEQENDERFKTAVQGLRYVASLEGGG